MDIDTIRKIEAGNQLDEQGKHDKAVEIYLSVFNELKAQSSFFQLEETRWLISCIINAYFSMGNYLEAKKWAQEIFNCNIPAPATSELVDLGSIYLELGETDKAYECFLKAYEKGKNRAFQDYDLKYWQFFKVKNGVVAQN